MAPSPTAADQPSEAKADVAPVPVPAPAKAVAPPDLTAGDLEDAPADPNAVSVAPPRPHESIVSQLQLRFEELIDFVRTLEGDIDGDLGELLAFVRSKIEARS